MRGPLMVLAVGFEEGIDEFVGVSFCESVNIGQNSL